MPWTSHALSYLILMAVPMRRYLLPSFYKWENQESANIITLTNVTQLGLEPRQSDSEHLQRLLASNAVRSWAMCFQATSKACQQHHFLREGGFKKPSGEGVRILGTQVKRVEFRTGLQSQRCKKKKGRRRNTTKATPIPNRTWSRVKPWPYLGIR